MLEVGNKVPELSKETFGELFEKKTILGEVIC